MPFKDLIRHQHGDDAVTSINRYNRSISKIVKTSNHLTFLLRCRDNNLVPRGFQLSSPVPRSPAINKIQCQHQNSQAPDTAPTPPQVPPPKRHFETSRSHLQDTLEPDLYHKTQSLAEKTKQHLHEKVKTTHITKFTQLQRPPTSNIPEANNTTNPKTVINLSSKPLTPSQTSLLAKGLKYVPVTAKINTDAFITSIESGLQQLAPNGNVDYLRHQIIDTIKQAPKPRSNLTHQERQAITELKKDDTITITEADKGKAAVIMGTPEFIQLVNNSLSDTTTYLNIKKDPTARLERQHKKTLKDLHEKREINDIIFNQLGHQVGFLHKSDNTFPKTNIQKFAKVFSSSCVAQMHILPESQVNSGYYFSFVELSVVEEFSIIVLFTASIQTAFSGMEALNGSGKPNG
ncbi:uncharacterized protein [Haliotis asinina]|uniref:uncharacterized protein n=1 Tax=Haliotis asinina TaxID=109174 RepID=UPI003532025B